MIKQANSTSLQIKNSSESKLQQSPIQEVQQNQSENKKRQQTIILEQFRMNQKQQNKISNKIIYKSQDKNDNVIKQSDYKQPIINKQKTRKKQIDKSNQQKSHKNQLINRQNNFNILKFQIKKSADNIIYSNQQNKLHSKFQPIKFYSSVRNISLSRSPKSHNLQNKTPTKIFLNLSEFSDPKFNEQITHQDQIKLLKQVQNHLKYTNQSKQSKPQKIQLNSELWQSSKQNSVVDIIQKHSENNIQSPEKIQNYKTKSINLQNKNQLLNQKQVQQDCIVKQKQQIKQVRQQNFQGMQKETQIKQNINKQVEYEDNNKIIIQNFDKIHESIKNLENQINIQKKNNQRPLDKYKNKKIYKVQIRINNIKNSKPTCSPINRKKQKKQLMIIPQERSEKHSDLKSDVYSINNDVTNQNKPNSNLNNNNQNIFLKKDIQQLFTSTTGKVRKISNLQLLQSIQQINHVDQNKNQLMNNIVDMKKIKKTQENQNTNNQKKKKIIKLINKNKINNTNKIISHLVNKKQNARTQPIQQISFQKYPKLQKLSLTINQKLPIPKFYSRNSIQKKPDTSIQNKSNQQRQIRLYSQQNQHLILHQKNIISNQSSFNPSPKNQFLDIKLKQNSKQQLYHSKTSRKQSFKKGLSKWNQNLQSQRIKVDYNYRNQLQSSRLNLMNIRQKFHTDNDIQKSNQKKYIKNKTQYNFQKPKGILLVNTSLPTLRIKNIIPPQQNLLKDSIKSKSKSKNKKKIYSIKISEASGIKNHLNLLNTPTNLSKQFQYNSNTKFKL